MSLLEQVQSALRGADAHAEVLRLTIEHFHADSGTLHLIEADGMLHLKAASAGIPEQVLAVVRVIPIGKGMAGLAAERREPITACNIQKDASGDVRPGARATGMEGALVVPVLKGEAAVGALGIANRAERTFTQEETALLMDVGREVGKA